jgi:hypothetical protein
MINGQSHSVVEIWRSVPEDEEHEVGYKKQHRSGLNPNYFDAHWIIDFLCCTQWFSDEE